MSQNPPGGAENPITHGPLLPTILQLSWPMMVGNFLQTAFNIIDMIFVGRLGPDAIAGVAMSGAMIHAVIETLEAGVACLEIYTLGFLAFSLNLIFGRALQGAGDTVSPLAITAFARLPLLLGLLYALPRYTSLGMDGLWYGFVITSVTEGAIKLFWFNRGKWKLQRV